MIAKNREYKNLIVGLDIGTSKIVAIVAEVLPEGRLEIIGMGQHPSRGLKKGVVVNIESTVNATLSRGMRASSAPHCTWCFNVP